MELCGPEGVQYHGHLPICPIQACTRGENLSHLIPVWFRHSGMHISKTAARIFSISNSMDLSRPEVVQRHGYFPICPKWACPWTKTVKSGASGVRILQNAYLKLLDRFTLFEVPGYEFHYMSPAESKCG